MSTHCFIPVLGKRIRVTTLDQCGAPPAGGTEDAVLATDGFVSVALSAETEEGNEIITRKASGALCVNEKMSDSFKRFTVEIHFCGVNPSLLSMTTNAEVYRDYAGDVAGFTVAEGEMTKKFGMELWTGMAGAGCAAGDEEASGYLLLPFIQAGVLGDFEVNADDAIDFSLTGAFTKGGNGWGVGPYEVVFDGDGNAALLPEALDPLDHLLLLDTGVAPPPSACDPIVMPDWTPAPEATGATAGTPGTWTPAGSTAPDSTAGITASPSTPWTTGQSVSLSGGGSTYWDGTAWQSGIAP